MLIVYALVITAVAFYFWQDRNSYRSDASDMFNANELLRQHLDKAEADLKFNKEVLQGLFGKQFFANLTEDQIVRIATTISAHLEKPKWLN